jgi:hypothetical protein
MRGFTDSKLLSFMKPRNILIVGVVKIGRVDISNFKISTGNEVAREWPRLVLQNLAMCQ